MTAARRLMGALTFICVTFSNFPKAFLRFDYGFAALCPASRPVAIRHFPAVVAGVVV
jgi:hypothetical protein